jgi:CRP/FNR family cyclic AMP-dependent transcriptional regulator
VKLTVVNEVGGETVVALLGPGSFFGEECLPGQLVRRTTATAIAPTSLIVIDKEESTRVLHTERAFCDHFVAYTLSRIIRIEQDLLDQPFNSSQ